MKNMRMVEKCPVYFDNLSKPEKELSIHVYQASCPQSGDFEFTYKALIMFNFTEEESYQSNQNLAPRGDRRRANASAWLRRNQGFRSTATNPESLIQIRAPGIQQRIDDLLLDLASQPQFLGDSIRVVDEWRARTSSLNRDEVYQLVQYLAQRGLISWIPNPKPDTQVELTPPGWAWLEAPNRANTIGEQGFVPMCFDETMRSVYDNTLAPAIADAGYRQHRVDRREFNDRIDDEIVLQIRRSRFLMAAFTSHRGAVYWEADCTHGMGLPVFFTCCKEEISKLHFDVRLYNCTAWVTEKDLRNRLAKRLEAVLGHRPVAAATG